MCLLHTVSATTAPHRLPYSSQVLLPLAWTEEELLAPDILMMPGEPVTEQSNPVSSSSKGQLELGDVEMSFRTLLMSLQRGLMLSYSVFHVLMSPVGFEHTCVSAKGSVAVHSNTAPWLPQKPILRP